MGNYLILSLEWLSGFARVLIKGVCTQNDCVNVCSLKPVAIA